MSSEPGVPAAKTKKHPHFARLPAIVAVGAALALLLGYFWSIRHRATKPAVHSEFTLAEGLQLAQGGDSLAFAPDGKQLVFVASSPGTQRQIWIRSMSSGATRAVPGTAGAAYPFWSPDGHSIGFFAQHMLKKVDLATGVTVTICSAEDGRGGAWNRQGTIVFAPVPVGGLYRVPAGGGNPIQVSVPESAAMTQRLPQFLPDGRHVLFFSGTDVPSPKNGIYALDLASGKFQLVTKADGAGRYVGPGYLAFARDGNLMVQRFDAAKLQLSDAPKVLARQIAIDPREWTAEYAFSDERELVYEASVPIPKASLTWLNLDGTGSKPIGAPEEFGSVAVSPDGRHAIAQVADSAGGFLLWLYELRQGASLRVTPPGSSFTGALWSPNGKQIAYADASGNLFVQISNAAKSPKTVLSGSGPVVPTGWSPNGKLLAYQTHGDHGWDIGILPLAGDQKPFSILATPFNETGGTFSTDGHWFSYLSDESGRNELYVVNYPDGTGEQKISADGAIAGGWVPGVAELAYVTPGRKLVVVSARTQGKSLGLGQPQIVLAGRTVPRSFQFRGAPAFFSADGKNVLLPLPVETGTASKLSLIQYWASELAKK